ncbi:AI-2E family transporter [Methylocystis hirsuta]|uniref:AI-2E family transporter n=1 Tax=Methylocystis hirsuta TaxID=369798 RepID=A0A3M9XK53_9HYPH|nr:AI-2E family transporter [Methylocystis hirsuta]
MPPQFRGVIGLSLLQSIVAGVGMTWAAVPGASLLALTVLVLGIIQLGPLVIVAPVIIWGCANLGDWSCVSHTICRLIVNFMDNFLKPCLLSRSLTNPTMAIFIGVIGGGHAHGVAGLFGAQLSSLWHGISQAHGYATARRLTDRIRCRNGPHPELGGGVVVPRMMVKRGSGLTPGPKHRRTEDNHGTLCRDRRVFGTLERLHCGCEGEDRERDESPERSRCAHRFFQGASHSGGADRARSRTAVTMATRRIDRGRF